MQLLLTNRIYTPAPILEPQDKTSVYRKHVADSGPSLCLTRMDIMCIDSITSVLRSWNRNKLKKDFRVLFTTNEIGEACIGVKHMAYKINSESPVYPIKHMMEIKQLYNIFRLTNNTAVYAVDTVLVNELIEHEKEYNRKCI